MRNWLRRIRIIQQPVMSFVHQVILFEVHLFGMLHTLYHSLRRIHLGDRPKNNWTTVFFQKYIYLKNCLPVEKLANRNILWVPHAWFRQLKYCEYRLLWNQFLLHVKWKILHYQMRMIPKMLIHMKLSISRYETFLIIPWYLKRWI